ncbi:cbb3-type cytochrome oxidase assembly protein CcoS [Endozoicomonas elysicola]|uniref:Cytochrome oxidase maturation protein Cbb3 n=1 Tax=Endozoicomonas elysicola TaxID=305900 RepID=A0A081KEG6_9GAMM|nr:cbb3-type cytochrome oxidase assembly protein CcoS [Endozoicomonas elysicola]KEI72542.1 cytochrome oxidase maturation protein Cbb3 [Endozoicomonas elysicola]
MESLIILIPLALILIAVAIKVFFWAVDDGQFDDLEGPAHSILFDEPQRPKIPKKASNKVNKP